MPSSLLDLKTCRNAFDITEEILFKKCQCDWRSDGFLRNAQSDRLCHQNSLLKLRILKIGLQDRHLPEVLIKGSLVSLTFSGEMEYLSLFMYLCNRSSKKFEFENSFWFVMESHVHCNGTSCDVSYIARASVSIDIVSASLEPILLEAAISQKWQLHILTLIRFVDKTTFGYCDVGYRLFKLKPILEFKHRLIQQTVMKSFFV